MDKAHSGELQRVLRDGGHEVPEALAAFGGTIKKKSHAAYGDHFKEIDPNVKATKIVFDWHWNRWYMVLVQVRERDCLELDRWR